MFYPLLGINQNLLQLLGDPAWQIPVERHVTYLVSLAHYFDRIILSPGAILFQYTYRQIEEIGCILSDQRIKALADSGIIASLRPRGEDHLYASQRITSYLSEIGWPNLNANQTREKKDFYSSLCSLERDGIGHSHILLDHIKLNVDLHYKGLGRIHDELSGVLRESVDPHSGEFMNERLMLHLLFSDIPQQDKFKIIKISTVGHALANDQNMRGIHNFSNLSDKSIFVDERLSAIYHPSIYMAFLKIFLGTECAYKLLNMSGERIIKMRLDHRWRPYSDFYHSYLAMLASNLRTARAREVVLGNDDVARLVSDVSQSTVEKLVESETRLKAYKFVLTIFQKLLASLSYGATVILTELFRKKLIQLGDVLVSRLRSGEVGEFLRYARALASC